MRKLHFIALIATNGLLDFTVISRLKHIIKDREIHVIHTHGYKSDITGLIATRITGIICTPHSFGSDIVLKRKIYIKLEQLAIRLFDSIARLSLQLVDKSKAIRINKSKISYISNEVDFLEADQHLSEKIAPDEIMCMGYIGQLNNNTMNLINDDSLREKLLNCARQYIDDNFSGRRMALENLNLYKSILNIRTLMLQF